MDNAEAIKRIKDHIRVHHIGKYPHIKIAEALNMAISALANDNNVGHKVEVVRCKDCQKFIPFVEPYDSVGQCRRMNGLIQETDFCSYGERREA